VVSFENFKNSKFWNWVACVTVIFLELYRRHGKQDLLVCGESTEFDLSLGVNSSNNSCFFSSFPFPCFFGISNLANSRGLRGTGPLGDSGGVTGGVIGFVFSGECPAVFDPLSLDNFKSLPPLTTPVECLLFVVVASVSLSFASSAMVVALIQFGAPYLLGCLTESDI